MGFFVPCNDQTKAKEEIRVNDFIHFTLADPVDVNEPVCLAVICGEISEKNGDKIKVVYPVDDPSPYAGREEEYSLSEICIMTEKYECETVLGIRGLLPEVQCEIEVGEKTFITTERYDSCPERNALQSSQVPAVNTKPGIYQFVAWMDMVNEITRAAVVGIQLKGAEVYDYETVDDLSAKAGVVSFVSYTEQTCSVCTAHIPKSDSHTLFTCMDKEGNCVGVLIELEHAAYTELANKLMQKLRAEQKNYRTELLKKSKEKILDCAYEYALREDFLCACESVLSADEDFTMISRETMNTMLNTADLLDDLVDCYESEGTNIIEELREIFMEWSLADDEVEP